MNWKNNLNNLKKKWWIKFLFGISGLLVLSGALGLSNTFSTTNYSGSTRLVDSVAADTSTETQPSANLFPINQNSASETSWLTKESALSVDPSTLTVSNISQYLIGPRFKPGEGEGVKVTIKNISNTDAGNGTVTVLFDEMKEGVKTENKSVIISGFKPTKYFKREITFDLKSDKKVLPSSLIPTNFPFIVDVKNLEKDDTWQILEQKNNDQTGTINLKYRTFDSSKKTSNVYNAEITGFLNIKPAPLADNQKIDSVKQNETFNFTNYPAINHIAASDLTPEIVYNALLKKNPNFSVVVDSTIVSKNDVLKLIKINYDNVNGQALITIYNPASNILSNTNKFQLVNSSYVLKGFSTFSSKFLPTEKDKQILSEIANINLVDPSGADRQKIIALLNKFDFQVFPSYTNSTTLNLASFRPTINGTVNNKLIVGDNFILDLSKIAFNNQNVSFQDKSIISKVLFKDGFLEKKPVPIDIHSILSSEYLHRYRWVNIGIGTSIAALVLTVAIVSYFVWKNKQRKYKLNFAIAT